MSAETADYKICAEFWRDLTGTGKWILIENCWFQALQIMPF